MKFADKRYTISVSTTIQIFKHAPGFLKSLLCGYMCVYVCVCVCVCGCVCLPPRLLQTIHVK